MHPAHQPRADAKYDYVRRNPVITCAHCGKDFDREPRKARQKFCTPECAEAGGWQARRNAEEPTWIPSADLTPEGTGAP